MRGRVQGVGFRPFVARLAVELGLTGRVRNTAAGVEIEAAGPGESLDQLAARLESELPDGGRIERIDLAITPPEPRTGFTIEPSHGAGPTSARVPADRATCAACLAETGDPANHRHDFSFAACTDCGPRFSVIESLPYDRAGTSLRAFPPCARCRSEYGSISDRRFHAQAINCPACGPRLRFADASGAIREHGPASAEAACRRLLAGDCIAVKGLGGYQLLVRADNDEAVRRLRDRKGRPAKPFAVMVADLAAVERIARIGDAERAALNSPENPIVLVDARPESGLAVSVAPGLATVGLFLPTTPLHRMLLDRVGAPLVATSGNRSSEPPATTFAEARLRLSGIADGFLDHDRPIVRRVDDSVVRVIAGRPVVLRLGRGFAPWPVPALERFGGPPLLAAGGHLKSAVALFTGDQAVLGPHIGDLDDPLTRADFDRCVSDLTELYRTAVDSWVVDMHPDYYPTRRAGGARVSAFRVQHHHAHAAAVQAEHDLLDRPCVAVTWDGTGLGDDGSLWGGETLLTEPDGTFRRVAALRPIPLLGGEAAVREPARIAFALLAAVHGDDWPSDPRLARLRPTTPDRAAAWATMLRRGVNCPGSTSVGRLIDGLAAIALNTDTVSYEGEAAVRFEAAAGSLDPGDYRIANAEEGGLVRGDWRPLVLAVVDDCLAGVSASTIASRVHAALAEWAAGLIRQFHGRAAVLGGGCFQNRLLTEGIGNMSGMGIAAPASIPPGDGGLAVGQLAVALQRRGFAR